MRWGRGGRGRCRPRRRHARRDSPEQRRSAGTRRHRVAGGWFKGEGRGEGIESPRRGNGAWAWAWARSRRGQSCATPIPGRRASASASRSSAITGSWSANRVARAVCITLRGVNLVKLYEYKDHPRVGNGRGALPYEMAMILVDAGLDDTDQR